MILWTVSIVLVLLICVSVFSDRRKSYFKDRDKVDTAFWQRFYDAKKLKYDEKRLLSVLDVLGSAFGTAPSKLRYDDNLRIFDNSLSLWTRIFGDSLLDAAIEELVCENLRPKTAPKENLATIGDIVVYSMEYCDPCPAKQLTVGNIPR